jgi:uncharacterized membrane protein YphA (DoxX/SURF4 family)
MEWIGIGARVLLGAVLLYAGWSKIRTRRWPLLALEAGIPRPVVLGLPAFELILGLLLVGQVQPDIVGWVGVALFVAFLAVVSVQFFTGVEASCNCFGGDGESVISWITIARNLLLLAVALTGALIS